MTCWMTKNSYDLRCQHRLGNWSQRKEPEKKEVERGTRLGQWDILVAEYTTKDHPDHHNRGQQAIHQYPLLTEEVRSIAVGFPVLFHAIPASNEVSRVNDQ